MRVKAGVAITSGRRRATHSGSPMPSYGRRGREENDISSPPGVLAGEFGVVRDDSCASPRDPLPRVTPAWAVMVPHIVAPRLARVTRCVLM